MGIMADLFTAVNLIMGENLNIFGFSFVVGCILMFDWLGSMLVEFILDLLE